MWRMTLKQRRRHGELMGILEKLKSDPLLQTPENYQYGENPEEDAKREATLAKFKAVVEEIHEIEEAARNAT